MSHNYFEFIRSFKTVVYRDSAKNREIEGHSFYTY